ncbi:hypothetical protein GCM10027075_42920 [Streptomyces heilongjiangensis]
MPGGNPFEDMSHERMLQWLDQANSATVQAAADRLAKAAEEIHKIAEELKIRPQWVEWKGEGANAFRTWTADLANSTLRLGDFSESSAKWLAQASSAIARAQAAIPRDTKTAESNRAAAASTPNDPDADAVTTKSTAELAALAENKEKVRREAAAEMIKLGQAYEFSAVQLNALERPKFPPPPEVLVPGEGKLVRDDQGQISRDTFVQHASSASGNAPLESVPSREGRSNSSDGRRVLDAFPLERVASGEDALPIRMGIDSVETLLPDKQTTMGPATGPQVPVRPDGPVSPNPTGLIPSLPGAGQGIPPGGQSARGRSGSASRMPQLPGQVTPSPTSGRVPGNTGIIGGRPVPSPLSGPVGATNRGPVAGAPGPAGRSSMGNTFGPAARVSQLGQTPGSRLPTPNSGVIGGVPQRVGRAAPGTGGLPGAGTPRAGTATPGTPRDAVIDGTSRRAPTGETEDTSTSRSRQPTHAQDEASRRGNRRRPENEHGRRQDNGRNVPPVID